MSRARNIKPGFFKNEILAELPYEFRVLFIGLWTHADREGRFEYRPRRIKAELFPYDEINVADGIAALVDGGFLYVYGVAGKEFVQVLNWGKHQNPHHKEVGSVIPAPAGHTDRVCEGYIPLSNTIRRRIYARDGQVCKECGATHGLSIDHIVPITKGGNSTDDNLQVLCLGCNALKNNKIPVHDSCMPDAQAKQGASCPTDSLIPDSLNRIPDSQQGDARPVPAWAVPVMDAYHSLLPKCQQIHVLNDKRKKRIAAAVKLAKEVCASQGWKYEGEEFWQAYFTECAADAWMRGEVANPKNPRWVQNLDVLLAEDRFAEIMDKAIAAMRRQA